MGSLYAAGWRQGSVFTAELPLAYVVEDGGNLTSRSESHFRWVVASQDCDLDNTDEGESQATIELRPVFADDPPEDWGIRSARLLVADGEYLVSASPRVTISGRALSVALERSDVDRQELPADRRLALKTWLGLRYDRPAVPTALVSLAQRISKEVRARRFRETAGRTRDVLMQFDESVTPPHFSLFAIVENESDAEEARVWLAEVALAVPSNLGVADEIRAATSEQVSHHLIETSYAADASQITWRANDPTPDGAT